MFGFHGTDTKAIDGSQTLLAVANFVAAAQRGTARQRAKLLTTQMSQHITKDDKGNIVVSYLAFCDLLGRRTALNNVVLREVEARTILRKIRNVNGLRKIGLDVFEMSGARFGRGDVGLLITKKFKSKADEVPSFFKELAAEPDMETILADGAAIGRRVA